MQKAWNWLSGIYRQDISRYGLVWYIIFFIFTGLITLAIIEAFINNSQNLNWMLTFTFHPYPFDALALVSSYFVVYGLSYLTRNRIGTIIACIIEIGFSIYYYQNVLWNALGTLTTMTIIIGVVIWGLNYMANAKD